MRLRWFPGQSFGPWPGIIGLMCGTLEHVRGWKLLCMIFNSSLPRFGGNGISERNPGDFYIHLKNSRYIPPYPLVTPPELEGWLEFVP